ncbi:MAG: type II toxin-antitoxin system VapC family toxin [Acaryochloridaceae cyanobacterium RL_2_7]|nr:type II toxin-antitoxin system VapC family toxin [Acaryochloridaceae cyanobacterium RL_2_7]
MKSTVYLETTVVSYLTARPSNDIRTAACKSITMDWWEYRRADFDLYISELVVTEVARGNEEAAARRLAVIEGIPELRVIEDTKNLAEALFRNGSLPPKAEIDAFHVAVAAVNGINYLLTWNCTHIANAVMRPSIEAVCRRYGFEPPIICTPSELLEG